jgi:NTE family protein
MGQVVKLPAGPARGRARRPNRTALVLGGGGVTGGVYEIGALRALDLLAVDATVNEFDVFVGTSAGSFVAALVAAGVTPDEMMRVLDKRGPAPFRDVDLGQLLRLDLKGMARRGVGVPGRTVQLVRELVPQVGKVTAMDLVLGLAASLPAGLYSGAGMETYLRAVLTTDDFRELRRPLYIAATDLDSGERIVFGDEGWDDVPISRAVRASTAMPVVYDPVRVGERELVDGGVVSTTNLDIAVEAGARLIIVVNPLVPYTGPARIGEMGLAHAGFQAFKLMAHQRLHEQARHWEERYPGVDILLIEPDADDELMFRTSIMNYAKRIEIARHGFASVTRKLAGDYDRLQAIAARHGIALSQTRLQRVIRHVNEAEPEPERAWKRILSQTTGTLLRQAGG